MAQFFPTRTTCRFDTAGERRLAERLEKKLEDDYLCWFNIPVGPKALQLDSVLMHPLRGLLVLEVNDWKLNTIPSLDRGQAKIYADDLLKTQKNPVLQARVYATEVVMMLQKDRALKRPLGLPKAGNLIIPFCWGMVMAALTRKQFEGLVLTPRLGDMPKKRAKTRRAARTWP